MVQVWGVWVYGVLSWDYVWCRIIGFLRSGATSVCWWKPLFLGGGGRGLSSVGLGFWVHGAC